MNRVIIFGATGFVGSNLAKSLEGKFEVISVGRKGCEVSFDLESDDCSLIDKFVKKDDFFIFLASISSPEVCEKKYEYALNTNVKRTVELIHYLSNKGVNVIFSSSDTVFGAASGVSNDDDKLNPKGAYGEMKAEVERAFLDDPNVKVIRFSYVFGRGDKFSEMLKEKSKAGECVSVFSGFERNVVLLSDVLLGINELVRKWGAISEYAFNFSGPELVARADIAALLKKHFYEDLEYIVEEAPDNFWLCRSKRIQTGCELFCKLLGRQPKSVDRIFEEGV